MLAHNVYFLLKDRTPAARDRLVSSCREHLTGHPGVLFFACGTLAEALDRPVNVRDWDVALHIVFESQAAHDLYQDAARHHAFVDGNKPTWDLVRVFDSVVQGGAPA